MSSFIYYPREEDPLDELEPCDAELDEIGDCDEEELTDYLEVELSGNRIAMVPVDLVLFLADEFQHKIMTPGDHRLH